MKQLSTECRPQSQLPLASSCATSGFSTLSRVRRLPFLWWSWAPALHSGLSPCSTYYVDPRSHLLCGQRDTKPWLRQTQEYFGIFNTIRVLVLFLVWESSLCSCELSSPFKGVLLLFVSALLDIGKSDNFHNTAVNGSVGPFFLDILKHYKTNSVKRVKPWWKTSGVIF